ncbi:MAG: WhiB family transcriptional regulator [Acidimicrobiales bacterium]|nr:WhiB family transcriptional regulator [Acidimicrobiales bacterium]
MDTEYALNSETDGHWRAQALCNGMTEVFFGPAAERPERRVEREALARSFCMACPSQLPCRRYARLNREHGMWGAENDEERAAAGYSPRSPSRRSVIEARDSFAQVPEESWDDPEFDASFRELLEEQEVPKSC